MSMCPGVSECYVMFPLLNPNLISYPFCLKIYIRFECDLVVFSSVFCLFNYSSIPMIQT